jgi:preprotein translocase subunit SecB
MAEEQQNVEKQFAIQKIYTKDLSFETPNSPKVFMEKWEPVVDFNLSTRAETIDKNLYEVVLTTTITVKIANSTAYLVEVNQAGIFTMAGFTDQELGPMVGSFCPNVLFPYAREVVSDLVAKGGFPQLLLAPVNFDALYAQHLQNAQTQPPAKESLN